MEKVNTERPTPAPVKYVVDKIREYARSSRPFVPEKREKVKPNEIVKEVYSWVKDGKEIKVLNWVTEKIKSKFHSKTYKENIALLAAAPKDPEIREKWNKAMNKLLLEGYKPKEAVEIIDRLGGPRRAYETLHRYGSVADFFESLLVGTLYGSKRASWRLKKVLPAIKKGDPLGKLYHLFEVYGAEKTMDKRERVEILTNVLDDLKSKREFKAYARVLRKVVSATIDEEPRYLEVVAEAAAKTGEIRSGVAQYVDEIMEKYDGRWMSKYASELEKLEKGLEVLAEYTGKIAYRRLKGVVKLYRRAIEKGITKAPSAKLTEEYLDIHGITDPLSQKLAEDVTTSRDYKDVKKFIGKVKGL